MTVTKKSFFSLILNKAVIDEEIFVWKIFCERSSTSSLNKKLYNIPYP